MTSFARAVVVDSANIGALGVGSVSNEGRLSGRRANWPSETVPGRDGAVLVATQPEILPRVLDLRFVLDASSRSNLLALKDEVLWRMHPRTEHTFRFVDDETREISGRVLRCEFPGIGPDLVQDACELHLQVFCPDPREYATTDTVVSSVSTTPVALPLGPDRSEAVIVVSGAGTFTLTYANSSAVTQKTLDISGATAPVTINMSTAVITDASGDASDHLVAGSDFPFSFDPQDGDFPNAAWPTLACSAGTAEATYRKAY